MQEPRAAPRAARSAERCFDSATLTLDDVYDLAELIGAEVEKLIDGYGKESVLGLVPRLVTALELLESFASRRRDHTLKEAELLETFEAIRLQQQRKRAAAAAREGEEAGDGREVRVSELLQLCDPPGVGALRRPSAVPRRCAAATRGALARGALARVVSLLGRDRSSLLQLRAAADVGTSTLDTKKASVSRQMSSSCVTVV
ncbi:hypothetical protein F2P81_017217 [Scophthalmus maximus]|uniref:RH1 domain-containing protein n=1 Tax=Scophthalmus maximus TaxID=52904 RepID=A0A6A4S5J8_SCOMX|nr:hypothetical protein F2P81_017217 [Scophthalmus maximus]